MINRLYEQAHKVEHLHPLDKHAPVPLHFQMYEALKAKILAGEWKAGEQIFSEADLMRQCKVSRAVVRHTLDNLANDGYLEREQGKGTFVRSQEVSTTAPSEDRPEENKSLLEIDASGKVSIRGFEIQTSLTEEKRKGKSHAEVLLDVIYELCRRIRE